MQIEILGSGGATTTPTPGCMCNNCVKAREVGLPYSRSGPSYFIHGPDVLIDTPEEIKYQLNRSGIGHIKACFYSHWHPDHTLGRRVWESNLDWHAWPPKSRTTDIYLPQQVALDFKHRQGLWEHFEYMQRPLQVVRMIELKDGETVTLGNVRFRPFRLAEDYVYAFLLEENDKRVLLAPDELFRWSPPQDVQGVDLAIIPMGVPELHPLTGKRIVPIEHPVLTFEATFMQTLEMVHQLKAKRVIMSHMEMPDALSPEELKTLEEKLHVDGFNITFAYDMMKIDV